ANEVKNKRNLEFELPPDLVTIFNLYIEIYRPRLANIPSPWLFPAPSGGHKRPGAFGTQLKGTIKRATGLDVNLHLLRHFAAKLILEVCPGAYEMVRLLLGHASSVTTTTFYCGSEQKAAFRFYDRIVDGFRKLEGGRDDRG